MNEISTFHEPFSCDFEFAAYCEQQLVLDILQ